jgi:hypothetical protein
LALTRTRPSARRCTAVALSLALGAGGAVALTGSAAALPSGGALLYGLTASNGLVSIRTASGVLSAAVPITGLDAGDALVGIDIRPATGQLYALGKGNVAGNDSLYVVTPTTGAATKVGDLTTRLDASATNFGVDVNPQADALRVVASTRQNLAVNLTTAAVTVQTSLTNPGLLQPAPVPAGAAYTDNVAGTSQTTLFDLDTVNNRLYTQVPSTGVVTTVGSLTTPAPDGEAGFDVDGLTGIGLAALTVDQVTGLYAVDLPTAATILPSTQTNRLGFYDLGNVIDITAAPSRIGVAGDVVVPEAGGTATVTLVRTGDLSEVATVDYTTVDGSATAGQDFTFADGTVTFPAGLSTATISVPITSESLPDGDEDFTVVLSQPSATTLLTDRTAKVTIDNDDAGALLYGLTSTDHLAQIRVADGIVGTPAAITGLPGGSDVVGIDVRPATGQLFAVVDGATDSLWTVAPGTGAATKVADLSVPLEGTSFGVDFNPTVDRLRIVSNSGQNLRVVPTTGAVTEDLDLVYSDTNNGTPDVRGAAYTNSVGGATTTALYDIDPSTDLLLLQAPPNNGVLGEVAPLGVNAAGEVGFDIDGSSGTGYASLSVGGEVGLYTVALPTTPIATAAVARVLDYALTGVEDITVATPRFSVTDQTVPEGATATFSVTRTGDTTEAATVTYTTSNDTASAGSDYTAATGTLTFAPGQASRSFTVATAVDSVAEADETVTITLSAATPGNVIGAVPAATLTISEVPPSVISLTLGPQVVDETAGVVVVPVTRTNAGIAASVDFVTADGGARAGQDYLSNGGRISFAAGESSALIGVRLLDDTRVENNESFAIRLSNPSVGALIGQAQAVVTTVSEDVRQATQVTLLATPQVQSPGQAVLAGQLTSNGAPVGGARVYILSVPVDGSAPLKVARTLTTQANGLFSTQVRPTVHTGFFAVFTGDTQLLASASPNRTVLVRFSNPTVSGQTTIARGSTASFQGVVFPGNSRPKVKLQYLAGNRWVDLTGLVTANQDGTYALARRFALPGTFRLRVVAPGTPLNNGSVSSVFTLRVT